MRAQWEAGNEPRRRSGRWQAPHWPCRSLLASRQVPQRCHEAAASSKVVHGCDFSEHSLDALRFNAHRNRWRHLAFSACGRMVHSPFYVSCRSPLLSCWSGEGDGCRAAFPHQPLAGRARAFGTPPGDGRSAERKKNRRRPVCVRLLSFRIARDTAQNRREPRGRFRDERGSARLAKGRASGLIRSTGQRGLAVDGRRL